MTLDIVAQQQLDGREWVEALADKGDAAAGYLTDEYDVKSAATATRLKLHALRAVETIKDRRDRANQSEREPHAVARVDYTKGAPRQSFEPKDALPNSVVWRQFVIG